MNSDALLLALVDETLENGAAGVQRLAATLQRKPRLVSWSPVKGPRHSPPGGITIAGVYYKGGAFIPGSVIAQATEEEMLALRHPDYIGVIRLPEGEFVTADEGEPIDEDTARLVEQLHFPESMVIAFVALNPQAKVKAVWYDARRNEYTIPPLEEVSGQQNLALSPSPPSHDQTLKTILDLVLAGSQQIADRIRREMTLATLTGEPAQWAIALETAIRKHAPTLARLLTDMKLAAMLSGAARQVEKVLPRRLSSEETQSLEAIAAILKEKPTEIQAAVVHMVRPDLRAFVANPWAAWQSTSGGAGGGESPAEPFVVQSAPEDPEPVIVFPMIEEAANKLLSRRVMMRADFDKLTDQAKADAFTVAGLMSDDAINVVRDHLADMVRTGMNLREFRNRLMVEGIPLQRPHIENVFRTGIMTAYSDGKAAIMSRPGMRELFPYVARYATHDARVRPEHLEMEKRGIDGSNIYRVDDPVWRKFRAPWAWQCRCEDTYLTLMEAAHRGCREAKQWLETGVEPAPPAFVPHPPFEPPAGWTRLALRPDGGQQIEWGRLSLDPKEDAAKPDRNHMRAHILAAILQVAREAIENGHPDAAKEELQALLAMWHSPGTARSAVRLAQVVRLAWTAFTTKHNTLGAVNEHGRRIYGEDARRALEAQSRGPAYQEAIPAGESKDWLSEIFDRQQKYERSEETPDMLTGAVERSKKLTHGEIDFEAVQPEHVAELVSKITKLKPEVLAAAEKNLAEAAKVTPEAVANVRKQAKAAYEGAIPPIQQAPVQAVADPEQPAQQVSPRRSIIASLRRTKADLQAAYKELDEKGTTTERRDALRRAIEAHADEYSRAQQAWQRHWGGMPAPPLPTGLHEIEQLKHSLAVDAQAMMRDGTHVAIYRGKKDGNAVGQVIVTRSDGSKFSKTVNETSNKALRSLATEMVRQDQIARIAAKKLPPKAPKPSKGESPSAPPAPPEPTKPADDTKEASDTKLEGNRPAKPMRGRVYSVAVKHLHVDPERFQYKLGTDKSGVTSELKKVTEWNPNFAGVLLAWRDPATNKDFVVNGHHRKELANRLGVDDLDVKYIEASTAEEARAIGAAANIAEGRGTAVDAAKFMRDYGVTPDDLKARGLSIEGKVARDAVVLRNLSDPLFTRLATGRLDEPKAIAIAKHLADHDMQETLVRILDKREAAGKELHPRVIEEMAREMHITPKAKKEGAAAGGLFGAFEDEESLFIERAEIKAAVRRAMSREIRDFQAVASERRAERVSEAGNILDTEKNRQIAFEQQRVLNAFDTLVNSKGAISDAVNAAAAEYAKAKSDGERDAASQRALAAVRDAVYREAGVGRPAGTAADKPAPTSPDPQRSAEGSPLQAGVEDRGSEPAASPAARTGDGERADSEQAGVGDTPAAGKPEPAAPPAAEPAPSPPAIPAAEPAHFDDSASSKPTGQPGQAAPEKISVKIDKAQTSRGERYVHSFRPNEAFWQKWRAGAKPKYISLFKNNRSGLWSAFVWGNDPDEVADNLEDLQQQGMFPGHVEIRKQEKPKAPVETDSVHDHLAGMEIGDMNRVHGFMVRRTKPDEWRIETQSGKGNVHGDAEKIVEHIQREEKLQGLLGRARRDALARADAYQEPTWMDADHYERDTRAFQELPANTPVVSLDDDADTYGRIGKIVKDSDGNNRVKLDGEDGFASNFVEPIDAKHSWRLPESQRPRKAEATKGMFEESVQPVPDEVEYGFPISEKTTSPADAILHRFDGDEGTEAVVAKNQNGFFVQLRDKDADKYLGEGRIFPTEEKAVEYAKTIRGKSESNTGKPVWVIETERIAEDFGRQFTGALRGFNEGLAVAIAPLLPPKGTYGSRAQAASMRELAHTVARNAAVAARTPAGLEMLQRERAEAERIRRREQREEERAIRAEEHIRRIAAALTSAGWQLEHHSGSSQYFRRGAQRVRVSDHDVPMTEERQHNIHSGGFSWSETGSSLNVADASDAEIDDWLTSHMIEEPQAQIKATNGTETDTNRGDDN